MDASKAPGAFSVSQPVCPYFQPAEADWIYPVSGYCRGLPQGLLMIPSIEEYRTLCSTGGHGSGGQRASRRMEGIGRMTERECIAYRCGFNDGLAVMREGIKDLLLENARLPKLIIGPAHRLAPVLNGTEAPISGEELATCVAQPEPDASRLGSYPQQSPLDVTPRRGTWANIPPRRSVRGEGSRACRKYASAGPSPRALPRGAGRRPSRALPADCASWKEYAYITRSTVRRRTGGLGR
jgi:hypothetical protein